MAIPYYPDSSFWSTHPVFIGSLFTIIAIIIAIWIGHKEARRKGLDLRMFYISALWMGAGALLGGRISYFLLPGPGFLDIMHYGFHSVGIILGGFFGMLFYCIYEKEKIKARYKKTAIYLWTLTDIWVLGAAIGTFFYRIGCFLIHCIEIGTPTNAPWAIMDYGVTRHPINIYYSMAGLIIFVTLIEIKKNGEIYGIYPAAWFLFLYSLSRFIFDFFREYDRIYGLSISQILFIIFFVISFSFVFLDIKYKRKSLFPN